MTFTLHRHKTAVYLALLLAAWGSLKVYWETAIERREEILKFHGYTINRSLRDQLGQGMMLGLLSGFRGVVADFTWLMVTGAWQDKQWFRVKSLIDLSVTLQPRFVPFWDLGGWHLAWNASVDRRNNHDEPNPLRRIKEERYWIREGEKVYRRGALSNPDSYELWRSLAMLYEQKLQDYRQAAECFARAAAAPGAPIFLERFPAYMYEKAGDDQAAYEVYKRLWLLPRDRKNIQYAYDKIEEKIRLLEKKLKVPREKRIFP
jgi:tetratricopeptide (TPR) repeat protein